MKSCHDASCNENVTRPEGRIVIALAGNPNVGKSTLFNAMTGLGVSTAHYPGTTREVHSATAQAGEHAIGLIDLPGTYGLSGTGEDEQVVRRALQELHPDVVVVVVDASTLARNLPLALAVQDLGFGVVLAVNLADEAARAGLTVDHAGLAEAMGCPVVSTTASRGLGIGEVVSQAFAVAGTGPQTHASYSADFEALVAPLAEACPVRDRDTCACGIEGLEALENANACEKKMDAEALEAALSVRSAVRSRFGEDAGVHLARERHELAVRLARDFVTHSSAPRHVITRDLWALTTSPLTGIPLVLVVAASVFGFLFFVGNLLATGLASLWGTFASPTIQAAVHAVVGQGMTAKVLLWGLDSGVGAALGVGIPYILTFYIILGLMEDSGYLNSLAFLTDRVMHRLGMHGRAIVPLIAAAGCNVPALMAAGQLGTKRERQIASTMVLFIPCSARTAVILGSVGAFIGWQAALMVLGIVLALWVGIALALERILPGDSQGLVMEMFGFRRPSLRRIVEKSWVQFREFLFVATPIVVAGSIILGGLYETGWLFKLSEPLEPLIGGWLGLPTVAGITLIVGFLRAELSLQLLIALAAATTGHATGISEIMSPIALVVFALVNTIALPCISSVAVYWRREGLRAAIAVIVGSVVVSVVVAGLVARVLAFVGFGA
ncbi:MAG: ferrous iron transport protein B [Actinobacteria bacterium]|nr:ferrous iron transport protein B [Actinomycetota bacterium]